MFSRFRISLLLLILIAPPLFAQREENAPETQKVELKVNLSSLELVWNGDQGEGGRGNGEVYITLWISWGEKKLEQGRDPQNHEIGPLNGDVEYPSGKIVKNEQTGKNEVIPHEVKDGKFGQIFYAKADCEVVNSLSLDVLVWDEDSGTDLAGFKKIIDEGVGLAKKAGFEGAGLAGSVIKFLADELIASRDDALGRFVGLVEIDDPCQGNFEITRELVLENLASDLWEAVNAEGLDEDGSKVPFRDKEIEPPENIGKLKLKIVGRPLGTNTSSLALNSDAGLDTELAVVDIGQLDECSLGGLIRTGAPIPEGAAVLDYSLYLDVDNNPLTGSLHAASQGAEYEARFSRENPEVTEPRLFAYDAPTDQFVLQPEGIHSFSRNIDDRFFQVAIPLDIVDPILLGAPAFVRPKIAAWGVVRDEGEVVDMLPAQPSMSAPAFTPSLELTNVAPAVVSTEPPHDAIDVDRSTSICASFSKTMMRDSVESAFLFDPPLSGAFSWQGDTVCFQPDKDLEPLTVYRVDICPSAVDCANTPLESPIDEIVIPGFLPCFQWSFVTSSPGLLTSSVSSPENFARLYQEGDELLVVGDALPPSSNLDLYLSRHDRTRLVMDAELAPLSLLGPISATTDEQGELGPVLLGSAGQPGEFNVIADLNRDGLYQPDADRIDRKGIGVAVAEPPGGPWFAPQIGNGRLGEVGFQTSQILVNVRSATTARLEYRDSTGAPYPVPFGEMVASDLAFFLPRGHSETISSTSTGDLNAGYTRITGAGGLGAITVLARLFLDPDVLAAAGLAENRVVLYEAGVPAIRPLTDFSIVVDSRQEKDTGLALLHPGGSEDPDAELTLRLYDQEFALLETTRIVLTPGEHRAQFIHELFQESSQAASEMLGSVTVQSSLPVAPVTLRQRDKPVIDYPDEVPTLATFPVVPGRADQIVPVDVSQGVEQQQVFFFPQMGDGVVANIRFQTSFIFLNPRIAGSGREVPLVIEFFASDGNPARIELTGRGSGSRFDFSLATGEVLALQTAGTAPIQAGYARITTGPSVGGTAVFTQSQIDSGIVVYEAGVPATGPIQEFSVVVDTLAEKDIGLAMVNPPQILPAGPPKSAQVTLRLYDNTFQLLGEEQLELAPGQHLPRFLNQFFESIANQLEDLRGLLTVASDRPLAVVTLRQRDDPSVDFPADVPTLTAFPVLTGRPETAP